LFIEENKLVFSIKNSSHYRGFSEFFQKKLAMPASPTTGSCMETFSPTTELRLLHK
jgi:hypothetical protein